MVSYFVDISERCFLRLSLYKEAVPTNRRSCMWKVQHGNETQLVNDKMDGYLRVAIEKLLFLFK